MIKYYVRRVDGKFFRDHGGNYRWLEKNGTPFHTIDEAKRFITNFALQEQYQRLFRIWSSAPLNDGWHWCYDVNDDLIVTQLAIVDKDWISAFHSVVKGPFLRIDDPTKMVI